MDGLGLEPPSKFLVAWSLDDFDWNDVRVYNTNLCFLWNDLLGRKEGKGFLRFVVGLKETERKTTERFFL